MTDGFRKLVVPVKGGRIKDCLNGVGLDDDVARSLSSDSKYVAS